MKQRSSPTPEPKPSASHALELMTIALSISAVVVFAFVFEPVHAAVARLSFPLAVALAQALGAIAAGSMVRRLIDRLDGHAPTLPSLTFDFVVGYPLFGSLIFLVSLASTSATVMSISLIAGLICGAATLRIYGRGERESLNIQSRGFVALLLLGISLGTAFLLAQAPPQSLDELAYHLTVPKQWVMNGRSVELPLNSHSYFPMAIESVDVSSLSILGNDGALASHFLHLLAAIAALRLFWRVARKHGDDTSALVATAAIATVPATLLIAGWSLNEWPLIGASLALLLALGDDTEAPSVGRIATAVAAGILCKYTFAFVLFPLILTAVFRRPVFRRVLVQGTVAGALLGSVFFVRNLFLTGNPLAPFFSAGAPDVTGFRQTAGSLFSSYLFDGKFIDEALGLSAIFLALLGILHAALSKDSRGLVLSLSVSGVLLLLLSPSSRILAPVLFLLAATGAAVLALPRVARIAQASLLALSAGQLLFVLYYQESLRPAELLMGRVTTEAYVQKARGNASDILKINSALPASSRTLVLGTNELFWFDRRAEGGGNFDSGRVGSFLERLDLTAPAATLRQAGFSHVAVFPGGIAPQAQRGSMTRKEVERKLLLTPEAAAALQRMLAQSRLIMKTESTMLFQL